jgi:hypothetical protein
MITRGRRIVFIKNISREPLLSQSAVAKEPKAQLENIKGANKKCKRTEKVRGPNFRIASSPQNCQIFEGNVSFYFCFLKALQALRFSTYLDNDVASKNRSTKKCG